MHPLEVSEIKPKDFANPIPVAGCYVEWKDKLLLLKRSFRETESETWGVPGGRIEANETPIEGAYRELTEETGIILPKASPLHPLGPIYLRKRGWNLVFHLFKTTLHHSLPISLSQEHTDYLWASHQELASLHTIEGFYEAYSICKKRSA